MITDFFINIFNNLIDLLPTIGVDWGSYSLEPLFNALETVNYYIPVAESVLLVKAILSFYLFRLGYRTVILILERIVI